MRPSVTFITIIYFLNAGLVLALPQGGYPLSDITTRGYVDDMEARELGHGLEKRQWAGLVRGLVSFGKLIKNAIKGSKGLRHIKQVKSSQGFKQIQHAHKGIDHVQQQQQQQQQQRQRPPPQPRQPGRKHNRRRGLFGEVHSQIMRRDHRLDYARRLAERHMDASFHELD
ncbi:hypothetical protein APHAL10511_007237 [Amanita phalloides]|nr:hypothetical protein APHAL10511_007237 [Amanita phalloides]